MTFELSTTAFPPGGRTPKPHTADGRNVSPPFRWHDAPKGTQSLALLCEDPDAPSGTFTHWLVYDLPPDSDGLPEGVTSRTLPAGAKHGTNSFGDAGYDGPAPPPGRPHRYVFSLLALDRNLEVPAGITREQFLAAVRGHVLAEARWVGTYGR